MREYYDRRAPEYDDWYLGRGLFTDRDRPGWEDELGELAEVIAALPAGADARRGVRHRLSHAPSPRRRRRARPERADARGGRAPGSDGDLRRRVTRSPLPFPDRSFDRVFTGHFYGHLAGAASEAVFLDEARRVARELVVVDASRAHSEVDEEMTQRVLEDGSRWQVYKRWFGGAALADELGGGEVLYEGRWFVVVRALL